MTDAELDELRRQPRAVVALMSTPYSIVLPWPPSVNSLFSQGIVKGKVRRFPTSKYKRWRHDAVILIRASRPPGFTEPVVVKIELTPPDCRARDADNFCKPILDALVEARVIPDDSNVWVKAVMPYWANPSRPSGVTVTIRLANPETIRPMLTGSERVALGRLKRGGCRLVTPSETIGVTLRALVAKGYARELPGLLEGVPQGFVPID